MVSITKYLSFAGLLNWLGARYLTVGRWQRASFLFKAAILINPRRPAYHTNLGAAYLHAGCNSAAQNCFKQALFIDPTYSDALNQCDLSVQNMLPINFEQPNNFSKNPYGRYTNTKEWCLEQDKFFVTVLPDRYWDVREPQFVNKGLSQEDRGYVQSGSIKLPEVYLANLGRALIIGQTSLVLTPKALFCDEQAGALGKYSARNPWNGLELDWSTCEVKVNEKVTGKAIHFCDDYSPNYFHWLTECLPRMWIIDQFPEYAETPLLVDEQLPKACIQSLEMIKNKREIIWVKKNALYEVEELIYPSTLSMIHDNYGLPKLTDDALISPEGVEYVRKSFLKVGSKGKRKLFIARRSSGYRDLLNSEEIEQILLDDGFEIVFPERMSFQNQVKVFSQASIIISQTAAGLANLIFAPADCKVYALTTKAIHNFYVFSMLADACGIELRYILGNPVAGSNQYQVHEDFIVPIDLVRNAIRK